MIYVRDDYFLKHYISWITKKKHKNIKQMFGNLRNQFELSFDF